MQPLVEAMQKVLETVKTCSICGNLDTKDPCAICSDPRRDGSVICIVRDVSDLWAIERSGAFRGQYHVLGGLLSAMEGTGPDDLRLNVLENRIRHINAFVQSQRIYLPQKILIIRQSRFFLRFFRH